MHLSVPVEDKIEIIEATEISPFISHAVVKVCYVGDQPNRNKTVITKEVATEMGKKLPGSPVVGFFKEDSGDYEEHNRTIEIKNGKFSIIDDTKPYGFVPTDARVWFQIFKDDGQVEREYLCTECYIWTTAYPESQRIIEQGNNQSMELEKNSVKGYWANEVNNNGEFFIFNEALIEKLCILGENFEPCFEGAQIKAQFSLVQEFIDFKNTMFSMINELKEVLNEGGSNTFMEQEKTAEIEEVEETVTEVPASEEVSETEYKEKEKEEEVKNKEDEEDSKKEDKVTKNKCEKDDEKKKYSLEEIPEYNQLLNSFNDLQEKYSALESELQGLKEFKLTAERKEKQDMINSFYMLSDEDKSDVIANIDTYSLDDIEAKLSVICVRNKVNFSLDEKNNDNKFTYSLNNTNNETNNVSDWILEVQSNMED